MVHLERATRGSHPIPVDNRASLSGPGGETEGLVQAELTNIENCHLQSRSGFIRLVASFYILSASQQGPRSTRYKTFRFRHIVDCAAKEGKVAGSEGS